MKEINYTSELWAEDRTGILRNDRIAFALKMAEKHGIKNLQKKDNTLEFTTYGARKMQGGYNSTTYAFRPATWTVTKYDVRTNSSTTKIYAYGI